MEYSQNPEFLIEVTHQKIRNKENIDNIIYNSDLRYLDSIEICVLFIKIGQTLKDLIITRKDKKRYVFLILKYFLIIKYFFMNDIIKDLYTEIKICEGYKISLIDKCIDLFKLIKFYSEKKYIIIIGRNIFEDIYEYHNYY